MKNILSPLTTLAIILAVSLPALAADVNQEIEALRQQVEVLRQGSIQSNSNAAQAVAELQELKAEMQSLRGSIDTNAHLITSQTQGMDLKLRDMDARIAALEERLKIQGAQVTAAVSTVTPEVAEEAELYQGGLTQVSNSEFLKAVATFKKYLEQYPKGKYTANATYMIGDCYYAMRDYEMAIKGFQKVVTSYPRSDKVPAALLKQGYSFIELDMESDAKLFLNTLMKKYPRTKEAKEAKERLERMQKLKEEEKAKPDRAPGGIPLAPGVELPEEEAK